MTQPRCTILTYSVLGLKILNLNRKLIIYRCCIELELIKCLLFHIARTIKPEGGGVGGEIKNSFPPPPPRGGGS